jgi:hypothetical protein
MTSRIEQELTDMLRCELIAQGVPDADQYRIEYVINAPEAMPTPAPVDPAAREEFVRRFAAWCDLPIELLDVPPNLPF